MRLFIFVEVSEILLDHRNIRIIVNTETGGVKQQRLEIINAMALNGFLDFFQKGKVGSSRLHLRSHNVYIQIIISLVYILVFILSANLFGIKIV